MANDYDHTTPYIPMDLIEIVLLKLPSKSLLRFKAVSEAWNDLISSPRFINSHHQRSKNSASELLFIHKDTKSNRRRKFFQHYPLIRLGDGGFQTELILDLPGAYSLNCFCDGLVLCKGSGRDYLLWNPSCRMHTRLYYPYEYLPNTCGLCRDPITDDVKVVVVSGMSYAVYSRNAKSWWRKRLNQAIFGMVTTGLWFDGAVYWVSFRGRPGEYYTAIQDIVYFDSRDDEFKMMEKPKDLKDTDHIVLVCFKDRLCVWFYNVARLEVKIWSWNQSSWMEFMTIEHVPTCQNLSLCLPVYLQENMILIQVEKSRFVIYRPIEKVFEEFEDERVEEVDEILPYMESLVFIPLQKTLPHRKCKSINNTER